MLFLSQFRLRLNLLFQSLSAKEQMYSHYISRASWYGGLIVLLQTSPESPGIFRLIRRLTASQSAADLKKVAAAGTFCTAEEYKAFEVYCSGFLCNMGNYKGFGDSKFVPNVTADKFEAIIKSSAAYQADKEGMMELWESVKDKMYSLSEREKQLGLGKKGVTTYFSDNCDQADSDKVNK